MKNAFMTMVMVMMIWPQQCGNESTLLTIVMMMMMLWPESDSRILTDGDDDDADDDDGDGDDDDEYDHEC